GPPREFTRLAPILRRYFLRDVEKGDEPTDATLIIDFPEKIIPAADDAGTSYDERIALVILLKWATSPEFRQKDVGVVLITETPSDLQNDLLQNPRVAQIKIDLPDRDERLRYLQSKSCQRLVKVDRDPTNPATGVDLTPEELA